MDDTSPSAERSMVRLRRHQLAKPGTRFETMGRLKAKYFRTSRDDALLESLEQCLEHIAIIPASGLRFEGRGAAVIAESGSGKSRLIRHTLLAHPLFPGFGNSESGCAAVSVRCPGACTLRVLGIEILRATGYPVEDLRENVAWVKVRARLKLLGILVLHVDEVNNLVGTSNDFEDQRIVNNLKAILNREDWPMVLLLSGTPACIPILQRDTQLRRRIDWIQLPRLTSPGDNQMISQQLEALCGTAGLTPPSDSMTGLGPRLIHAGANQFGIVIELSIEAIGAAISAGSATLGTEHFATAYARRTSCVADENPFVAAAWYRTDTSIVLSIEEQKNATFYTEPGRRRNKETGR